MVFLIIYIVNRMTIYSQDGAMFSSSAYAEQLQEAGSQYLIHFRRPKIKNYKLHYGFDWMRKEYIAETDTGKNPDKTTRGGICINQDASITKEEAQNRLKQEYTPISIKGIEYYIPWISLYKNHQFMMAGSTNPTDINFLEHEAWLELEMTNKSAGFKVAKTDRLYFEGTSEVEVDCSKINKGKLPKNQIYLKQVKTAKIAIRCKESIASDQRIYVYDSDQPNKNLVGALNVFKNTDTYKAKVRYVKVDLDGSLEYLYRNYNGQGLDGAIVNYTNQNSQKYDPLDNVVLGSNRNFNKLNFFNAWEAQINADEDNIRRLFYQSLIKYEPIKDATGVIDFRHMSINFGNNFQIASNVPGNAPIDKIKRSLGVLGTNYYDTGGLSIFDIPGFLDGLYETYEASLHPQEPDESLTIFVLPVPLYQEGESIIAAALAYKSKLVLLMLQDNWANHSIAHEMAHTLLLQHPFESGIENPTRYGFEKYLTENVMDYNRPEPVSKPVFDENNPAHKNEDFIFTPEHNITKRSFWKWQWEKMHQDNDLLPE